MPEPGGELKIYLYVFAAVVCLCLLITVVLLIVVLHRQKKIRQQTDETRNLMLGRILDEIAYQQGEVMRRQDEMGNHLVNTLNLMGQNMADSQEALHRLMETMKQDVNANLSRMDASLNRQNQVLLGSMASMQKENNAQLAEIRKTVDEKLTENLNNRLRQSFSQVSEELEKVYRSLGEMQTLAANVGDLKRVLTNVKTRGTWGEMQLGAILESILSPGQYESNVAVVPGSAERVEYAVRLPGNGEGPVYLPLDSKFPQEDYLRLVEASEAGDKAATDEARKALGKAIRQEGKRIQKYIRPPYSTDFAIMFLPVEGLYAEVVRTPELVSAVQENNRVMIAGPSTLAALLNSLQMGFRTLAIEQRSSEVWKLLGTIKEDFSSFNEVLTQTQNRLNLAAQSLDTAFKRSSRISRDLNNVQTLEEHHVPEEALPGRKETEG